MQETIRAIVISRIPYTDNSTVVRLYTREKGMISCIAGRMHGRKGCLKSSMFQPLSILNAVIYTGSKGMPSIREASPVLPLHSISSDPLKASVGIFLTEVLSHTLIESHPDTSAFDFIEHSLLDFEMAEVCPSDFHLSFLWKLTTYIGIGPRNDYHSANNRYFDIINGCFAEESSMVTIAVSQEVSDKISYFLNKDTEVIVSADISRNMRKELIQQTVSYYAYHLGWQNGLKSLSVLHEVFEG